MSRRRHPRASEAHGCSGSEQPALDSGRGEDIVAARLELGAEFPYIVAHDLAAPLRDLAGAQNRRNVGAVHQGDDVAGGVVQRSDIERRGVEQDDVGVLAGGERAGPGVDLEPPGAADRAETQRVPDRAAARSPSIAASECSGE
jgi:hypothetical protein